MQEDLKVVSENAEYMSDPLATLNIPKTEETWEMTLTYDDRDEKPS